MPKIENLGTMLLLIKILKYLLVEAIFWTEQNIFMHKHYHTLIDILVFVNKVYQTLSVLYI